MKIKKITDYPLLPGFTQAESAILGYNGFSSDDIADKFFDLSHAYSINDYLSLMEPIQNGNKFLEFIKQNKNKKFCIVGDYDCDGIMATIIMSYGLTVIGINTTFTISNRFETGYGMHKKQIDVAKQNNCDVIITVDNGITANETIDYAHSLGMKVIVTDHHMPQGENHADLVIDPFYNSDNFKTISGATVAMKLIYELYKETNFLDSYMHTFVAMAYFTVYSDVMAVLGENRAMIRAVEPYLNNMVTVKDSVIHRLADLVEFYQIGASDSYLELDNTYKAFNKNNVDFYFVPVINACNRVLGDVTDLVYDIMSLFVEDYNGIPHLYSGINKKRKYMKSELLRKHKPSESTVVVEALTPEYWDDNYSGIVGLVASDIVEKENKPALIGITMKNDDNELIHFSGRSVSGFNLFQALTDIKTEHPELEFDFGGHAEALGASCKKNVIPELQKYLSEKYAAVPETIGEQTYFEITNIEDLINSYSTLWPFGNKFVYPNLYIESSLNFVNKADREFTLSSIPNIPIIYFDRQIGDRLYNHIVNDKNTPMKFILSFLEDGNNQLELKLISIMED